MKRLILAALAALAIALPAHATERKEIPGGWYSEAHVNRTYVAAVRGSHIETHAGNVPFPQGIENLYTRMAKKDGRFAGVGSDDNAWEFVAGKWINVGTAFGVNAIIYNAEGQLVIVKGPGPTGSQGYRYVADNGRLVSGDESYADAARHIWEYTNRTCAGVPITVGQGGDEEGTQALIAGRRVLIEPGIGRRIVFNCEGNRIAIAIAKFAERKAVLIWTTVEELQALPTYTVPTAPPPVPQPPPSPPAPKEPASLKKDVEAERRTVEGVPTKAQLGEMLNRIAFKHRADGWGLSRKTGGNRCPSPAGEIACDILHHKPTNRLYDVFGSSDTKATPMWLKHQNPPPASRPWVAPVGVEPPPVEPEPQPEPEPEPIPVPDQSAEIAALKAEIAAANQRMADLAAHRDELARQLEAATAEIERLRAMPKKECEVTGAPAWMIRLFGIGCAVKEIPHEQ